MLLCRKKYINVSVAFLFCSQKLKPEVELQLMLTSGDRSLTDGLPMSNFFQIRARQLRKYKTIFIPKAVKRLRLTFSQAKLLPSEKTQNSRTASRHATQNLVLSRGKGTAMEKFVKLFSQNIFASNLILLLSANYKPPFSF